MSEKSQKKAKLGAALAKWGRKLADRLAGHAGPQASPACAGPASGALGASSGTPAARMACTPADASHICTQQQLPAGSARATPDQSPSYVYAEIFQAATRSPEAKQGPVVRTYSDAHAASQVAAAAAAAAASASTPGAPTAGRRSDQGAAAAAAAAPPPLQPLQPGLSLRSSLSMSTEASNLDSKLSSQSFVGDSAQEFAGPKLSTHRKPSAPPPSPYTSSPNAAQLRSPSVLYFRDPVAGALSMSSNGALTGGALQPAPVAFLHQGPAAVGAPSSSSAASAAAAAPGTSPPHAFLRRNARSLTDLEQLACAAVGSQPDLEHLAWDPCLGPTAAPATPHHAAPLSPVLGGSGGVASPGSLLAMPLGGRSSAMAAAPRAPSLWRQRSMGTSPSFLRLAACPEDEEEEQESSDSLADAGEQQHKGASGKHKKDGGALRAGQALSQADGSLHGTSCDGASVCSSSATASEQKARPRLVQLAARLTSTLGSLTQLPQSSSSQVRPHSTPQPQSSGGGEAGPTACGVASNNSSSTSLAGLAKMFRPSSAPGQPAADKQQLQYQQQQLQALQASMMASMQLPAQQHQQVPAGQWAPGQTALPPFPQPPPPVRPRSKAAVSKAHVTASPSALAGAAPGPDGATTAHGAPGYFQPSGAPMRRVQSQPIMHASAIAAAQSVAGLGSALGLGGFSGGGMKEMHSFRMRRSMSTAQMGSAVTGVTAAPGALAGVVRSSGSGAGSAGSGSKDDRFSAPLARGSRLSNAGMKRAAGTWSGATGSSGPAHLAASGDPSRTGSSGQLLASATSAGSSSSSAAAAGAIAAAGPGLYSTYGLLSSVRTRPSASTSTSSSRRVTGSVASVLDPSTTSSDLAVVASVLAPGGGGSGAAVAAGAGGACSGWVPAQGDEEVEMYYGGGEEFFGHLRSIALHMAEACAGTIMEEEGEGEDSSAGHLKGLIAGTAMHAAYLSNPDTAGGSSSGALQPALPCYSSGGGNPRRSSVALSTAGSEVFMNDMSGVFATVPSQSGEDMGAAAASAAAGASSASALAAPAAAAAPAGPGSGPTFPCVLLPQGAASSHPGHIAFPVAAAASLGAASSTCSSSSPWTFSPVAAAAAAGAVAAAAAAAAAGPGSSPQAGAQAVAGPVAATAAAASHPQAPNSNGLAAALATLDLGSAGQLMTLSSCGLGQMSSSGLQGSLGTFGNMITIGELLPEAGPILHQAAWGIPMQPPSFSHPVTAGTAAGDTTGTTAGAPTAGMVAAAVSSASVTAAGQLRFTPRMPRCMAAGGPGQSQHGAATTAAAAATAVGAAVSRPAPAGGMAVSGSAAGAGAGAAAASPGFRPKHAQHEEDVHVTQSSTTSSGDASLLITDAAPRSASPSSLPRTLQHPST